MVTIVLLNVAWIWACPTGTFFRSRRLTLAARFRSAMLGSCSCLVRPGSADHHWVLLLAPDADGLLGTAPLTGIRLRPLPAHGQVAPVAQAAIRPDLLEALDVERDLSTQV